MCANIAFSSAAAKNRPGQLCLLDMGISTQMTHSNVRHGDDEPSSTKGQAIDSNLDHRLARGAIFL